ncbi:MAG: immunoglobulin domain-containing protein [Verrucomicrobiota bacterium]
MVLRFLMLCLLHNPLAQGSMLLPAGAPLEQLGSSADGKSATNGLAIVPTSEGARLRCVLQRLEGRVVSGGLWLSSTAEGATGAPFQVSASGVGRGSLHLALQETGKVIVSGKQARWIRPGVIEDYRVGVDGVQQDFLIDERPPGSGPARVDLKVTGATVEQKGGKVQLVLVDGGRRIVYHRLKAEDARGNEVNARLEVKSPSQLAVVLEDEGAEYPVRIDPTFSDANWTSLEGVGREGGVITTMAVDDDGTVYVGGLFAIAGDEIALNIAKWNGSSWSALGSGLNGIVRALCASGTNLYVGGDFTSAGGMAVNHIAKWDGNSWSPLGSGTSNTVYAITTIGSNVYAGGLFTSAGGVPANYIARWDGTSWSAMGTGLDGIAMALAASGQTLFVGGYFSTAGGLPAMGIAQWNGSSWATVGSGLQASVYSLTTSGTNVYAGGWFILPGATMSSDIVRWDGNAWSELRTNQSMQVKALAVMGGNLYAANYSYYAPNYVTRWDGNSWSSAASPNPVLAFAVSGDVLFAGGAAGTLDEWDGSIWASVAPIVRRGGTVHVMALTETNVFIGGDFTQVGSVLCSNIAQWNGTAWSPLGSGMSGVVRSLAISGTNLFAGGDFVVAGDITANHIALWNGYSWSPLGSGTDNGIAALAVSGTNIYAGGWFQHAGGVSATNIAQWNGVAWSPMGSIDGAVYALAISGTNLFAGGILGTSGGVATYNVARWNGTSWSALGAQVVGGESGPVVYALAVFGNYLYAGGSFAGVGGVAANNVARWNGTSWSALGQGVDGRVHTLAASENTLFVGGEFVGVTGGPVSWIAQWDGSWSSLGSGMDYAVYSLALSGNQLFVGGGFTMAGTNAAPGLALAQVDTNGVAPIFPVQPVSQIVRVGTTAIFTANASAFAEFTLAWYRDGTAIAGATNSTYTLPNVQLSDAGSHFFCVASNSFGCTTSSIVTLTTYIPISITRQPVSLTVSNTSPATFSLDVTGSNPVYSWYRNGSTIPGGTNASYVIDPAQMADNDSLFFCIVSNGFGSATSSVVHLTVYIPLAIISQPTDLSVFNGSPATFSVSLAGSGPLTIHWMLNGTNLPEAFTETVAGVGTAGYSGDGGRATNASLYWPTAVAVDSSGSFFIADEGNSCIRQVSSNGIITTVAGTGAADYTGDGGPATSAALSYPDGVAVDGAGNLYIADSGNNVIRRVNAGGSITTVAGTGAAGYSGDSGPAITATLSYPETVLLDTAGNVYIADSQNNVVRKVDTNGIIRTVAGSGVLGYRGDGGYATNARLSYPYGLALDSFGNLFIGDSGNHVIRKVSVDATISTVAGDGNRGYSGDGGPARSAHLAFPNGVGLDIYGNLFISDGQNNAMRKVDLSGIITTVPGTALAGAFGLACDTFRNVYVADTSNNRIRKITRFSDYPVFTLNQAASTDSGNYSAVISSPFGTVTTRSAVLSVTWPAPNILNSAVTNGTIHFTWSTIPGHAYQVQFSADLTSTQWQNLGAPLTSTGDTLSSTDSMSPEQQRYYRVVLEP